MTLFFDLYRARKNVLAFFPEAAHGAVADALMSRDPFQVRSVIEFHLGHLFDQGAIWEGDVWEAVATYWDIFGEP